MLRARIRNSIRSFPLKPSGGTPPFSFGNALEFDGTDDYVDFTTINLSTEFTFSAWFKTTANFQQNLIQLDTSSSQGILFRPDLNRFTISSSSGSNNFAFSTISLNTWYHVFGFRNSSNQLFLYLNSVASSGNSSVNSGSIGLSVFGKRGLLYSPVTLDEIAIWDGVTGTAQNAIDLYNGGAGAYANEVISNPTAYWRMNGTSGDTTAIDEQGTYNGTLNNFNTSTCWVAH